MYHQRVIASAICDLTKLKRNDRVVDKHPGKHQDLKKEHNGKVAEGFSITENGEGGRKINHRKEGKSITENGEGGRKIDHRKRGKSITENEEGGSPIRKSKCPSFSQEELKKIYGQSKDWDEFDFYVPLLKHEDWKKEHNGKVAEGLSITENGEGGSAIGKLKYPSFSQEELKKIYGRSKDWDEFDSLVELEESEEEEESEEDEISDEQFEGSEEWQLLKRGVDKIFAI